MGLERTIVWLIPTKYSYSGIGPKERAQVFGASVMFAAISLRNLAGMKRKLSDH